MRVCSVDGTCEMCSMGGTSEGVHAVWYMREGV